MFCSISKNKRSDNNSFEMFAVWSICGLSKTNRSITTILMKIVPSSVKTTHSTHTHRKSGLFSHLFSSCFFPSFSCWNLWQDREQIFKNEIDVSNEQFLFFYVRWSAQFCGKFFVMIHQKLWACVCFAMYRFPVLLYLTFQKSNSKLECNLLWTLGLAWYVRLTR